MEKKEMSAKEKRKEVREYIKKHAVLYAISLFSDFLLPIGMLLLGIGYYQNYKFHQAYDVSGLTKAGVRVLRELSDWPHAITFMVIGAIIFGVSLFTSLFLGIYVRNILISNTDNQKE